MSKCKPALASPSDEEQIKDPWCGKSRYEEWRFKGDMTTKDGINYMISQRVVSLIGAHNFGKSKEAVA